MTDSEISAELQRVKNHNKYLRPLNKDARQLQDVDRIARERWVTRDARLQNLILSSINNSLTPQVCSATAAYNMYMTLKELNNSSDYANAQLA
jgi:IS30 family transposase